MSGYQGYQGGYQRPSSPYGSSAYEQLEQVGKTRTMRNIIIVLAVVVAILFIVLLAILIKFSVKKDCKKEFKDCAKASTSKSGDGTTQ